MRKCIVLLIVALVFCCDVYSQTYGVIPTAENNYPTVTITQRDYDTLLMARNTNNAQMELIAKEEAEKMFSSYTEHIGWLVGLFGVLITILVGLLGALFPYMTNENYRREFDGKIEKIDTDISNHNKKIDASNQLIDGIKKKIESQEEKINIYNKRIAISIATQSALTQDIQKQISFLTAAITIDPENCNFYSQRAIIFVNRGKNGDYEKAMEDINKGLSLNPNETLRRDLEKIKNDLEAKIQEQEEAK